ncbi:MAG: prolyl oligopeptidase family serine peptidase, partial [Hyphomonadaceae bacterium]
GARETARVEAEGPLIPRSELFADAPRARPALNPQGDRLAFLAPRAPGGPLAVFVADPAALGAARLVAGAEGPVADFAWAAGGRHILYTLDIAGRRGLRAAMVEGEPQARTLTPESAGAEIVAMSPAEPNIVLVAVSDREAGWPDLHRIDIATGESTRLDRNTRRIVRYIADRQNELRLGLAARADGGIDVLVRERGAWRAQPLFSVAYEDAPFLSIVSFGADGRSFLMLDSTNRQHAGLFRVDAETGERTLVAGSERADVVSVWLHPLTRAPEAFVTEYLRREWRALEPAAQADLDFFAAQGVGDLRVLDRTREDRRWLVVAESPAAPPRYFLYDRPIGQEARARALTPLFSERPALAERTLQPMAPVEIPARDGRTLVSYLTLPRGADANGDSRPDRPLSLAVIVHDGPWSRASYAFDAMHQWLANRGYAVLSVNYRGSTGFGRAFAAAGDREWGRAMQSDLVDAANWAADQRIAIEGRIALIGEGYGGYAALMGVSDAPGIFSCAVAAAPILNLEAWRRPEASLGLRAALAARVSERAALPRPQSIRGLTIIAQGARDPRFPRAAADAFAANLRTRNIPYTLLFYPDEGASLARGANRISFYAAAEQMLADPQCLGGPAQGLSREDFSGSSAQLIAGGARIEGLGRFAPPQRVAARPRGRPVMAPAQADALIEEQQRQRDVPIATRRPQSPARETAKPADAN